MLTQMTNLCLKFKGA